MGNCIWPLFNHAPGKIIHRIEVRAVWRPHSRWHEIMAFLAQKSHGFFLLVWQRAPSCCHTQGLPLATDLIQGIATSLITLMYSSEFTMRPLLKKWGGIHANRSWKHAHVSGHESKPLLTMTAISSSSCLPKGWWFHLKKKIIQIWSKLTSLAHFL